MKEEWKDVVGWEGLYKVSNSGSVKSLHRKTPKTLNNTISHRGYPKVTLFNNGVVKGKFIHRLVYEAFNGKVVNQINHIDEVKTNNHISNLEDVTSKVNNAHSKAKLYNIVSPSGYEYRVHNLKKFCIDNSLDPYHMYSVHNGNRKSHKGWRVAISQ